MSLQGRNVGAANRTPIGFEKVHSTRTTRHEQRVEPMLSHHRFRSRFDAGPARRFAAAGCRLGELLLVWRQQIRSAIFAKVAALRIDDDEWLSLPFDNRAKDSFGDNPLVVIRAHDSLRTSSGPFYG